MSQPTARDLAVPLPLVTDEQADTALHQLSTSAKHIGWARSEVIRTEAMLKHVKAVAAALSTGSSFQKRENDALASPQYKAAIEEYAEAVIRFETLKAERENSVMVLECWRSAQANLRAARL